MNAVAAEEAHEIDAAIVLSRGAIDSDGVASDEYAHEVEEVRRSRYKAELDSAYDALLASSDIAKSLCVLDPRVQRTIERAKQTLEERRLKKMRGEAPPLLSRDSGVKTLQLMCIDSLFSANESRLYGEHNDLMRFDWAQENLGIRLLLLMDMVRRAETGHYVQLASDFAKTVECRDLRTRRRVGSTDSVEAYRHRLTRRPGVGGGQSGKAALFSQVFPRFVKEMLGARSLRHLISDKFKEALKEIRRIDGIRPWLERYFEARDSMQQERPLEWQERQFQRRVAFDAEMRDKRESDRLRTNPGAVVRGTDGYVNRSLVMRDTREVRFYEEIVFGLLVLYLKIPRLTPFMQRVCSTGVFANRAIQNSYPFLLPMIHIGRRRLKPEEQQREVQGRMVGFIGEMRAFIVARLDMFNSGASSSSSGESRQRDETTKYDELAIEQLFGVDCEANRTSGDVMRRFIRSLGDKDALLRSALDEERRRGEQLRHGGKSPSSLKQSTTIALQNLREMHTLVCEQLIQEEIDLVLNEMPLACDHVRYVELRSCEWSAALTERFTVASAFRSVSVLSLVDCTDIDDNRAECLAQCNSLQTLRIARCNQLREQPFRAMYDRRIEQMVIARSISDMPSSVSCGVKRTLDGHTKTSTAPVSSFSPSTTSSSTIDESGPTSLYTGPRYVYVEHNTQMELNLRWLDAKSIECLRVDHCRVNVGRRLVDQQTPTQRFDRLRVVSSLGVSSSWIQCLGGRTAMDASACPLLTRVEIPQFTPQTAAHLEQISSLREVHCTTCLSQWTLQQEPAAYFRALLDGSEHLQHVHLRVDKSSDIKENLEKSLFFERPQYTQRLHVTLASESYASASIDSEFWIPDFTSTHYSRFMHFEQERERARISLLRSSSESYQQQ